MQQTDVRPFIQTGNTVSLIVSTTTSVTAITAPRLLNPNLPGTMRIINTGSGVAWFTQGPTSSTTANAAIPSAATPVPAGNTEVFFMLSDTSFIAGVSASGATATLYITPGQGS